MSCDRINNSINSELSKEEWQALCNCCGMCCKTITSFYSQDELIELAEQGNDEAEAFLKTFKKYSSIEDARKVNSKHVDNVIEHFSKKQGSSESLSFYYCPYITEDNKCSIHQTRPVICQRTPRHGWIVMPPHCGFEGWQFEERERQKKIVRGLKEQIKKIEALFPDGKIPNKTETVDEVKAKIEEKIKHWERFGARFW